MKKEKLILPITFCVSGKCDRGCLHCFLNGNMGGELFSLENASLFSREIQRLSENKKLSDAELMIDLQLTGNGEPLLNPNLIDILDLIMGENNNVICSIITSGMNPKSPAEMQLLLQLAKSSYARRLKFCLSFNEFQKDFPVRLSHSLDVLFKNGVEDVVVKACLPYDCRKIINSFLDVVNGVSLKRKDFLADDREFISLIKKGNLKEIFSELFCGKGQNLLKDVENQLVKARIDKYEIASLEEFLLINFNDTIQIETEYGHRRIIFSPHPLSKRGRAEKLDPKFIIQEKKPLCSYLIDRVEPHLDADGYYYPYTHCPKDRFMRIGNASSDIMEVLRIQLRLQKEFLRAILANPNKCKNICDICLGVAKKYC